VTAPARPFRVFRTTAFKLALGLLGVFVLTAVFALGYVLWQSNRLIHAQIAETVNTEVQSLSREYEGGGVLRLAQEVEKRGRQPGSFLYLLTAPNGLPIAGNVGDLPPGALDKAGQNEIPYARRGETRRASSLASVRVVLLPNGFRLLVGRDLAERGRFAAVLVRAVFGGTVLIVLLGLAGGLIVAQRVLRRIDIFTDKSRTIMAGDLSGRLPLAGTDDEFDRLAVATNAMLERIEGLMGEVRAVTDNIAHDLKTPLTRLRNNAEEALRTAESPDDYRLALEKVIDESDGMIGIFNAILLIARVEAGMAREIMQPLDAAELVEGMAELYEPVAEEGGVACRVAVQPELRVFGNRELLGQALANLLDNALKYAHVAADGTQGVVSITAERQGEHVLFAVADRGRGIAEADRNRALERFGRLEQSRSLPGSGLGLSLAAAIARLHGGELRLEDNAPGLRAVLVLPATLREDAH